MLINESAGSGGDALPYYFQLRQIGPLVGTRTWGGLVGTMGVPPTIDGGGITAPGLAFYDLQGKWAVENEGIAPDVEVEYTPARRDQGPRPAARAGRAGRISVVETEVLCSKLHARRRSIGHPSPDSTKSSALLSGDRWPSTRAGFSSTGKHIHQRRPRPHRRHAANERHEPVDRRAHLARFPAEKIRRVAKQLALRHARIAIHGRDEDARAVRGDPGAGAVEPDRVPNGSVLPSSIFERAEHIQRAVDERRHVRRCDDPLRPASATSTVLPRTSACPDSDRPAFGALRSTSVTMM